MTPSVQMAHIGLCNPKNPENVGSVMRAAGCYGADEVRFTGRRYLLAAKHRKNGASNTDTKPRITSNIPLVQVENMLEKLSPDTKIVCFELVVGAKPLPEFRHPDKALYIFGPEDGQIPQSIVDQAHYVLYVPTATCMNLAASVNVVLYDRLAKGFTAQKESLVVDQNEWIRKTRDNNNRLRVKTKEELQQQKRQHQKNNTEPEKILLSSEKKQRNH